ncbi:MAG: hypothetical protein OEV49_14350 [candidate division Zixibacteria bacterium]|nr:hypothetical protein [candidate division Zixibacteria bacterium]MDH3939031.1 hypothetical protein [candidate division Zixibacteria bacterium]MDH4033269.1 hypothetical protein [candidate division Zixibacteria bacterium]
MAVIKLDDAIFVELMDLSLSIVYYSLIGDVKSQLTIHWKCALPGFRFNNRPSIVSFGTNSVNFAFVTGNEPWRGRQALLCDSMSNFDHRVSEKIARRP